MKVKDGGLIGTLREGRMKRKQDAGCSGGGNRRRETRGGDEWMC